MNPKSVEYSFLDLTVMSFLRKKVISSSATLFFDGQVSKVLWANAAGAELFGGSEIAELLDARLIAQHPLVRQILLAAEQLEHDELLHRSFRINRGLQSEMVKCELVRASLPNGDFGILLTSTEPVGRKSIREHELAESAVNALEGFADAAAIIDHHGLILASSVGFDELDVDPAALELLIKEAASEQDRLVKRPIQNAYGNVLAAGLGRIRDVPARFLVVLAETDISQIEADAVDRYEEAEPEVLEAQSIAANNIDADDIEATDIAGKDFETTEPHSTGDESSDDAMELFQDEADADFSSEEIDEITSNGSQQIETSAIQKKPVEQSVVDRWYFPENQNEMPAHGMDRAGVDDRNTDEQPSTVSDKELPIGDTAPEQHAYSNSQTSGYAEPAKPVRFAFTVDTDQIVRSVSPELREIVGVSAADIVDRSWSDISSRLKLDQDGIILKLLAKGDTWSGRSVLWPIANTDLVVPIDLAALPSYDKDRNFDGFRGFGVARLGDSIIDPDATGLALEDLAQNINAQQAVNSEDNEAIEETATDALMHEGEGDAVDETNNIGWQTGPDVQFRGKSVPPLQSALANVEDDENEQEHSRGREHRPNVVQLPVKTNTSSAANNHANIVQNSNGPNLSGKEKLAFSEISKTLKEVTKADSATEDEDHQTPAVIEDAQEGKGDFANRPVPTLIYRSGETLFANQALLDTAGYTNLAELSAAGGIDVLVEGDLPKDPVDVQTNISSASTIRLRHRDGRSFAVEPRLSKTRWKGATALCLTFAAPNEEAGIEASHTNRVIEKASLTGNERSELQKSSDLKPKTIMDMIRVSELENILETAADGILVIDQKGSIEALNGSGEALFGRAYDEVKGRPVYELFAVESRAIIANSISSLSSNSPMAGKAMGKSAFHRGIEVIGLERNGGLIPLFVTFGQVGENSRVCAVLRDMTEWKRNEEELVNAKRKAENASEQKSEFLSRMSHEIREPLNSIIGFSDVMIEERFGRVENPRYRDYLKDINRSGIHLLDLVNDLLDISKIEAGKLELSYEAVDLNTIAAETVALLQPQANEKRIIIRSSFSTAVPNVVADLRSIRQIMLNLLSNAVRHSPVNSQVVVSTVYEENGEVGLRIRDTGKGMTAEELEKAMQPFSTLARESDAKGTGLGLPLTKALIEANRAYFELESKVGEGTIAHVQFPSQRVLAD